ncbi:MAG: M23 family metallopeptidase [Propionibacteriaceae bacterium]|jgi:murein DD-endopeptidase MepM/ murein hydrolase activator NlpD|nr:M23 family metallopeptidase [Propionibacteriaceae bacterium]
MKPQVMKPITVGLILVLALALPSQAVAAPVLPPAVAPLPGAVVRAFEPPAADWQPGHRGVDIAGQAGDTVVAAAAGVVHFAGMVAGRGVVSIDHGGLRTTYEPVEALVRAGDQVFPGDVIGRLRAGHPCPAEACLHWGLKQGETYLDPLSLLVSNEVRLISAEAFADLGRRRDAWVEAMAQQALARQSRSGLLQPVDAPITSPFGYRINPLGGYQELHDGTDFGAACGTPVRAASAGTIVQQGWYGGFGNRVLIDHGTVGGQQLRTSYNHLSAYALAQGATVAQGEVIGYVGTTGWSTGCHLHFSLWADGALVDPMTRLGG